MMRSTITVALLSFAACGPAQMMMMMPPPHMPGDPITSIGTLEGSVVIIAWPGYIKRGANDPGYDWVTQFEHDTGCMVQVKTGNTSDEMVALMNQGGVDLVTASGDASLTLVYGDR